MTKDEVRILQGNVDAVRGMELLLEQKREFLLAGYQQDQMNLLPGALVLQLEGGEVHWMVFNGEFRMEIWKDKK